MTSAATKYQKNRSRASGCMGNMANGAMPKAIFSDSAVPLKTSSRATRGSFELKNPKASKEGHGGRVQLRTWRQGCCGRGRLVEQLSLGSGKVVPHFSYIVNALAGQNGDKKYEPNCLDPTPT